MPGTSTGSIVEVAAIVVVAMILSVLIESPAQAAEGAIRLRLTSDDGCPIARRHILIKSNHTVVESPSNAPAMTMDDGSFVFLSPRLVPGERVSVEFDGLNDNTATKCEIFFPPYGAITARSAKNRQDPDVVILLQPGSKESQTTAALRTLMSNPAIKSWILSSGYDQVPKRIEILQASVRQRLPEHDAAFARLVARQLGQIRAYGELSLFLNGYANRTTEMFMSFDNHAVEAIGYKNSGPTDQLNEAIKAYNPSFNELRDKSDQYIAEVQSFWGIDSAEAAKVILTEALTLHKSNILPLLDVNRQINKANFEKKLNKSELQSVREKVNSDTAALTGPGMDRLKKLEFEIQRFLDMLKTRLVIFDDPEEPKAVHDTRASAA